MDGSITRRGKDCWYKLKDVCARACNFLLFSLPPVCCAHWLAVVCGGLQVGLDGVNDSLILESFIYFLIEKYFAKTPIELDLIKLYHEVTNQPTALALPQPRPPHTQPHPLRRAVLRRCVCRLLCRRSWVRCWI